MYINENEIIIFKEYFDELVVTGKYGGHNEVINTIKIFNCNIVILEKPKFNYIDKIFNLEFKNIVNKNNTFLNLFSQNNSTRLGLALNYSVFYYEIKKATNEAIIIAEKAFDESLKIFRNIKG